MQLLNTAELEARLHVWLEKAQWTRELCGRWIFTWNAFQIECDPQSVVGIVEAFDLRGYDLRDGALIHEPGSFGPVPVSEKTRTPEGALFTAELAVDPAPVRRANAESDVAVGEILGKPVTFDEAFAIRSAEEISGTIAITFEADADGQVWRRAKQRAVQTVKPNGTVEMLTETETTERSKIRSGE